MTLKNKDGSTYRLRGPNPLMREQELWRDFKLHNFQFKGVVVADTTEVTPFESPMHVNDFVGELEAGIADGQVTPQAGQDLYNHLQQLLFSPPGHDPQRIQQYAQLLQSFDQHRQQGQITGHAAIVLRHALHALAAAVGGG